MLVSAVFLGLSFMLCRHNDAFACPISTGRQKKCVSFRLTARNDSRMSLSGGSLTPCSALALVLPRSGDSEDGRTAKLRDARWTHGRRRRLIPGLHDRGDLRAAVRRKIMLHVFGDLRAHELLRLRWILDVLSPQSVALLRMRVEVNRAVQNFALHGVQGLRLHGNRDIGRLRPPAMSPVIEQIALRQFRGLPVAIGKKAAWQL